MDRRLAAAPVLTSFADRLATVLEPVAVWVGGSLASGDYVPAVSDLDVVALVPTRPTRRQRAGLVELHQALLGSEPGARRLHCAYLPRDDLTDLGSRHWTWASGELFRRPVSGIARAELLADPVVVSGPAPVGLLAPTSPADLRMAARAELSGYWSRTVRRRRPWLQDVYVDLGLFTLARAEATLTEGRLITKREALDRLHLLGVDRALAEEVARRRDGETVVLTPEQRRLRAEDVRTLVSRGIARLLATPVTSGPASSYYDTEAPVYDASRGGAARARGAAAAIAELTDGHGVLLDVAGGTGSVSLELARRGFSVWVVEPSAGMRSLAADRLPGRVVGGSGERLPVCDGSVDVVTMVWLLHLLATPLADRVLDEAVRVLRPGGCLVTTVDKSQAHGRPGGEADDRSRVTQVLARYGLFPVGESRFTGTSAWGSATSGDPVFSLVAFSSRRRGAAAG